MTPRKSRTTPPGQRWCWRGQHYAALESFARCDGENDGMVRICKACDKVYRYERAQRRKAVKA